MIPSHLAALLGGVFVAAFAGAWMVFRRPVRPANIDPRVMTLAWDVARVHTNLSERIDRVEGRIDILEGRGGNG